MLHIIVNPAAGNGRAVRIGHDVEQSLQSRNIPFIAHRTTAPTHATALAREAARSGATRILSIGGDGTSFEVVNGLIGFDIPLGILPAGTGNDFARTIGLPKSPLQALSTLLTATPRAVNICSVNDRTFLNVCGSGLDVEVIRASQRAKFLGHGMLPYLYGIICALIQNKPTRMRVTVDGEQVTGREWLLVAIANGQYIGGGMHVAPMARLDDDFLDVILVRQVNRRTVLRILPEFITGTFIRHTDLVEHRRARTVDIEGENLFLQCDGELLPVPRAHMEIQQRKLLLLMPEKAGGEERPPAASF